MIPFSFALKALSFAGMMQATILGVSKSDVRRMVKLLGRRVNDIVDGTPSSEFLSNMRRVPWSVYSLFQSHVMIQLAAPTA